MEHLETALENNTAASKLQYARIIISSVLVMICAGSVYAWSVFVAPLRTEYGYTTTQTQLIYGLDIVIFSAVMIFVHHIYAKLGPRITTAAGAVFFGCGYLVASLSQGNIGILILGIDVLSGIGMGLAYMTVMPNLVKWLPQHKGLATGIAVAGFGTGTIIMTQIASILLNHDWPVMHIFRFVGIVYGIVFLICALSISAPKWITNQANGKAPKVNYKELFKERTFWVLFYTAFAASFGGLMFYGNAKPLGISYGISAAVAVQAVILMSVGNAAGRLLWGQVHDMIGSRKSILISIFLVAVCIPLILAGVRNELIFMILVFIFGFCFGADQVLYASNVATIWGIEKLNIIYPLVFMGYGFSGIIAPMVGGMIFDSVGSYTPAMIISVIVCLSGIPVYAFLMTKKKETEDKAG